MKAAIYARLSDDQGGKNDTGVGRQLQACRDFAAARGIEVVAEFEDADLSAFRKGVVRPGYEEMLSRLDEVDVVIVWKLDRLVRRFLEFARLWPMFDKAGIALMSATEPIDTSSAIGRIIVLMLVGFAELESETISLRSRAKHAELRRLGKWSGGGARPYGFTGDRTGVVPEEAALLEDAAERVIAGESLTSIAKGMSMSARDLGRILRSPRLVGRREGQEVENGPLLRILPDDTFEAVQAVLARHRANPAGTTRRHLLSGLLFCSRCDARMKVHHHQEGLRYRCMSCFQSIKEEPVRLLVSEAVLDLVDRSAVPEPTEDDSATVAQLQADETALVELTRARYVDRILTDAEFRTSRDELVTRIEFSKAMLARTQSDGILAQTAGKAREAWASADLSWRRALLGAVLDRVVVSPAVKSGRGSIIEDRLDPVFRAA